MSDLKSFKLTINGRVQNVGFRRYFQEKSKELNISGWVRNTLDGRVEALIKGKGSDLLELYSSILSPNDKFVVNSIDRDEILTDSVPEGFRIRKTRVNNDSDELKKTLFLKLVDELYESPLAAGLAMNLPQRLSDALDLKAKEFYRARITRENLDKNIGYSRGQLDVLVRQAHPRHITHKMLRHIERRRLPVERALSFHTIMMQESEERRIGSPVLGWKLDEKTDAYKFADAIGLRRPDCNSRLYSFSEINKPSKPMVLKPVRSTGARGVTFFYSDDDIVLLRDKKKFSSWEEFSSYVNSDVLKNENNISGIRDRWMLEELILEDVKNKIPARDLKFYTFYGKVVFILEIVRGKKVRHCFWSRDGERLSDTGKYIGDEWVGDGVSLSQIEKIEEVSLKIPVPFMRIDMLKGVNEMVLGEFTPRPGQWDEFTEKYDRWLGEEHVKARARILKDLLSGKKFPEFMSLDEI